MKWKGVGDTEREGAGGPGEAVEILLVEDNPNDVELTLRVLKEHRLANHVLVARDGAEALEVLLGEGAQGEGEGMGGPLISPRVVLLDLKLPKVSGLEVLERIRKDPRTRRLPVVVITSSQDDPDVQAAYELGANSYVVKPVEFEDFAQMVKDLSLYWLLLNHPPGAEP